MRMIKDDKTSFGDIFMGIIVVCEHLLTCSSAGERIAEGQTMTGGGPVESAE